MLTALEAGNPSAVSFFRFQAFTTAVVQDQRIRGRLKDAIDENLTKGEGYRQFRQLVDDEFDKAGLTRLHNYQINNIYETNVSLAFGAGQMQKMLEVSDEFPYWKYSATLDSKTRPSHAALHGKIFKAGDFTFFPPIGFCCRCTAIPLTARQAGRYPKTDMPTPEDKNKLYDLLESKEFAGNKQQKFMEWTAEQYKNADPETRKLIDQAFDTMRQEIRNLKDDNSSFIKLKENVKDYYMSCGQEGVQNEKCRRNVVIYENRSGVQFIIPKDCSPEKQHITIKQLSEQFEKMPEWLQKQVTRIELADYQNPMDSYWAKRYKIKNFRSYATGGKTITFYANDTIPQDKTLLETLRHESGHNLDRNANRISMTATWNDAIKKDQRNNGGLKYISPYANRANSVVEDFADSIDIYCENPAKFKEQYPNRCAVIENIIANL